MSDDLDRKSTFTEKIEHDSSICNNCYRRLFEVLEPHDRMPDCVTSKVEYTQSVSFDYFDDHHGTGRPSIKKSYCKCGTVDDGKVRPLSKSQLIEISQRVGNRLEENGIDFDKDVFFDSIREMKSSPEYQFNEEKIIETAIEKSLNKNE